MLLPVLLMLAMTAPEGLDATADRSEWNVLDQGAARDASADAAGAFQAALDAAAAAGGGTVLAPTGRYRFDAPLTIPSNVALEGVARYAPAHAGLRDADEERPEYGTVFEVYAGAGSEDGAFITVQSNAVLRGVTVYYPEQDPQSAPPTPYPWAVALRGNNPAVIDCQLLNPYNGIDASENQRALVRNIHGQPLSVGLLVNKIYDIGRIENVHWNPWWTLNTPVYEWQRENGIGFAFARTDWHYVLNAFCFGYSVGYLFTQSPDGAANGNFLGIGADACHTAVQVDQTAPMGILITNGEFVAMEGEDPTMVRVADTHSGTIRFVNCAFWGPTHRNAYVDGTGTVGFSDCSFMQWGHGRRPSAYAIEAAGGSLLVRGCEFMDDKPQVRILPGVARAIVTENLVNGEVRIDEKTEGNVVIRDNLGMPDGWRWEKQAPPDHGFRLHARQQAEKRREEAERRD